MYRETNEYGDEVICFKMWRDIRRNVKAFREKCGMSREAFAKKIGIPESRAGRIERAEIRTGLELLKKISSVLSTTVDVLIEAKHDSKNGECLYLVWPESCEDFKLYRWARSAREAYFLQDKTLGGVGVRWLDKGEAAFVRLVGVPVDDEAIKRRFPASEGGDEEV